MNIMFDFIIVLILILGTLIGIKKGLIRSLVSFIGLIAVVIISYALRRPVAEYMIDNLPLFKFDGLSSLSVLLYNIIAFMVIFIILYSILCIILKVTKFIDTLLKITVVWIIPSKIGGAIIGFFKTWMYVYLILFVMVQFSSTSALVISSGVAKFILNHTPIIGGYMNNARGAAEDIYGELAKYSDTKIKDLNELNAYILEVEVSYDMISEEKAKELIENGKVDIKEEILEKKDEILEKVEELWQES